MIGKLYSLITKYNFRPDNNYDQNFMINKKTIKQVIDLLDIDKNETILEIGPGTGFLTEKLVENAKKVIAIEKDEKMCDILSQEIESDNLELINNDVLQVDINKFDFNKIVSFVPYSISKDLIYKILPQQKKTILVLQKEFCEKLIAIEGYLKYNAITVIINTYYDVSLIKDIPASHFYPKPKCRSAILLLKPKKVEVDKDYNAFIKELFRYSKKDVLKAIKLIENTKVDLQKLNKKEIEEILEKKVKQVTIEEFKLLYSTIK